MICYASLIFYLQHSKTFDVLNVFPPLTIDELSTLKQVRFLAHPVYVYLTVLINEINSQE